MIDDIEAWLTPKEVAARLGINAGYVVDLARSGKMRFATTKLGTLLEPHSVEAFARERAEAPKRRDGRLLATR